MHLNQVPIVYNHELRRSTHLCLTDQCECRCHYAQAQLQTSDEVAVYYRHIGINPL